MSNQNQINDSFDWSATTRLVVSLILMAYLAIVLLGPLSNPVASAHFSGPLARQVAPVHQALFLGHGYRFFAPDPGASHRVIYRGLKNNGSEFSGHFPDRESNWPRLLYHRWFMLSETLFNEQVLRPSDELFQRRKQEYEVQIQKLRREGKLELLEQLTRERELETQFFETTTKRVDLLVRAVAQELMERNDGKSIELFIQERQIPYPEEVRDGLGLDDPGLLSSEIKIGEMDADGFRSTPKPEILPAKEESK